MKRVNGLVFLLGAASFIASAPASAATSSTSAKSTAVKKQQVQHVKHLTMADLAPADEYFGPLKMSILGIRNTIKDLGLRYDVNPSNPEQTLSSAAFAETAIREWAQRYPRDDQLPRNVYFLEHLYAKIQTPHGQAKAQAISTWLMTMFADSPQAHQLRKELLAAKNAPAGTAAATTASSTSGDVFSPFSLDQQSASAPK